MKTLISLCLTNSLLGICYYCSYDLYTSDVDVIKLLIQVIKIIKTTSYIKSQFITTRKYIRNILYTLCGCLICSCVVLPHCVCVFDWDNDQFPVAQTHQEMGTDLGDVVQDHRNALYWLQEVNTTQLTETGDVEGQINHYHFHFRGEGDLWEPKM